MKKVYNVKFLNHQTYAVGHVGIASTSDNGYVYQQHTIQKERGSSIMPIIFDSLQHVNLRININMANCVHDSSIIKDLKNKHLAKLAVAQLLV